jgi:hypothetical protein
LCFGTYSRADTIDDETRFPAEVIEAYHTGRTRSMSLYVEYYFRDRLMPDDPADLWTQGPDIGRAADWWRSTALRKL